MKPFAPVVILLALCVTGWAGELVPFTPPWDDAAPGPTDISGTLEKPAGKSGFVHVKDGHLFTGNQRLRLFGMNLTAGADFPDHETAQKVAARMAKFGINAVRFHFIDSVWGDVRLIRYESGNWRNWNAESLDRLDYFVAKLKEHGIYSNLNLLVGRRFGVGDGVDPKVNQLDWKAAHAVGFFHAPHLETQKQYAKELLTHRNPYTKLTYAEEPAVAMVEINNENGLIHTWFEGKFDALPDVFAGDLQKQWNAWLAGCYANTSALGKAWGARNEPLGGEMLKNASFARNLESWNLEQHQGASVATSTENGAAVLRVRKTGSAGWHVQLNQPRLAVKKGGVYTFRLRAAADSQRKVALGLMQAHAPWSNLGFHTHITLTKEPQSFLFTFIADEDDANARLGFSDMNQQDAEFRFSELSFRPGGRVGLGEGESLEQRNLPAPKMAQARALPAGGRRDWIRFLWETERKHWTAMQRFLKEELKVRVPVVGTIVDTSTPNLMADLDLVDTHAYWQHPHFPGKHWDMNNWFVKNFSMVDYPDTATVTQLSFKRVAGKPHMVSEYNHPAPNMHAGEGPLMIAAFGALQDWDAIFLYTYSHDDKRTKANYIPGFFDIGPHPAIMANVPVASLLFRRADLAPAKECLLLPLPVEKEIELVAGKGHAWQVLPIRQMGLDLKNAVVHRIALDLSGRAIQPADRPRAQESIVSDTGELTWSLPAKDQGVFELRSSRAKTVIGHVDRKSLDLGHGVQVTVGQTRTNWCTLSLVLLEGETLDRNPRRVLVVAGGVTENTAMGWRDQAYDTVGANWGKSPSLVEPVAATLQVPRGAAMPMLYPLNDRGQRGSGVEGTAAGEGKAQFAIGPPHQTIWYEIDYTGGK